LAKIEIDRLTKTYAAGGTPAVDGLSLTVSDGEFLTLLGPSGCGKTTTLRCIAGLERPTAGSISFDGTPVASQDRKVFVPPEKRQMGMVFQSYALWPHMTCRANISYPLRRARKASRGEITKRVDQMLSMLGLADCAERMPGRLSGGQQQRVALGRALINEPRVVLFDEPFSNLDTLLRSQMRGQIRRLHDSLGTTSVYVTHDQVEAMALSDRVVVMRDGLIQQIGTPRDVYRTPANEFVASFMGFENILDAVVTTADGDSATISIDPHAPPLSCTTQGTLSPGDTVRVALRASSLRVVPAHEGTIGNHLSGEVVRVDYLGDDVELHVRVGDTTLVARSRDNDIRRVTGAVMPSAGDVVSLTISPEELVHLPNHG
jgi:iron(III) transport system ATP-binding protein